jgi:hypothetical protein
LSLNRLHAKALRLTAECRSGGRIQSCSQH